jgi:hypothetical protein
LLLIYRYLALSSEEISQRRSDFAFLSRIECKPTAFQGPNHPFEVKHLVWFLLEE